MDITEQLIEIVRSNPCLYDVQVKGYKCRKENKRVWRDIAKHFNISVEQCKNRWKGLRDCYHRCQRMKQRIKGVGTNNAIKWRYFGAMSFLEDVESAKRATLKDSTEKCETEFADFPTLSNDTMHSEETVSSFSIYAVNKLNTSLENSSSHLAELPANRSCSSPDITVNNRIDVNEPIELYFLSLARQIKDAGLPKGMIINIEATMSAYIFDTIQEWLKNKDKRH